MRPALAALVAALGLLALPAQAADIAGYFKAYYAQQAAPGPPHGLLGFLTEAAASHVGADQLLKGSAARIVTVDSANGYLQIYDGSGTDQTLTMALYRKTDGSRLLVVGSSDCADGCTFSLEIFAATDRLQPLAPESVLPNVPPDRFIKPGQSGPKNTPKVNYVPARIGTSLTLKPWYGYETEETMDKKTRAAIQDVELAWDRDTGRFR
jgi:hypothetical protein